MQYASIRAYRETNDKLLKHSEKVGIPVIRILDRLVNDHLKEIAK